MNAERRKVLCEICVRLDELISEEQEAFDNLPESLQDSEQAENIGNCIDEMQNARDELEQLTF